MVLSGSRGRDLQPASLCPRGWHPLLQNNGSAPFHVASQKQLGDCPAIRQQHAKLLTTLSRPGGPLRGASGCQSLTWHKHHAGKLTLHHLDLTLQLTNTLGFPQAFLRRPHSSSGFSLIVVAVDTALKPGARQDGSKVQETQLLDRETTFPKSYQN